MVSAREILEAEVASSGVLVKALLTPGSQQILLQRIAPVHEWVKGTHMTIAFNPPMERFEQKYQPIIGQPVALRVVGQAQDEKGQAVVVEAMSENRIPHITISCASGIGPVYSNQLLAGGYEPLQPFNLEAEVAIEKLDARP